MRHTYLLAASLLGACAVAPSVAPDPTAASEFTFRGAVTDPAVTHVVAISEVAHVVSRVVAPIRAGGFTIAVTPDRPWLFVFVDDTQIGRAKTVGVFRAGTLDTLVAASPGEVDLGAIQFAAGSATAALDDGALHAALGLDDATAAALGAVDDFSTRYANVDLDGDGVLDAYQPGFAARLEVHADMRLVSHGRAPTLADLVAGDMSMRYLGASVSARMPDKFGAFDLDTATVTFDAAFYGLASGADSPVVPPGSPIHGADLVMGTDHNFGVYGRADHRLPAGHYRFAVPGGALEFTDVRPSVNPVLAPFMRLDLPAACAQMACVPDALHFDWRRSTEEGWVPATDAEIALLSPAATVQVLQTSASGTTYRSIALPTGIASGAVPWDDTTALYTTASTPQPAGDVVYMAVRFGIALGVDGDASFAVTPLPAPPRAEH